MRNKQLEAQNQELTRELRSMNKIQKEQGRALERITDENDYPSKIKQLVEELRYFKERNRVLDAKCRDEERKYRQQSDHLARVEESLKELKAVNRVGNSVDINKPYHVSFTYFSNSLQLQKADEKIDELVRVNHALQKAREKDVRMV